jgi:3'-phosphoadenosine 5'-phosphosulfate (PAPS) 3'-phosphatase
MAPKAGGDGRPPHLTAPTSLHPRKIVSLRHSRLALVATLVIVAAATVYFLSFLLFRMNFFGGEETVEPHRLFELVAQSLIAAGREVVRLRELSAAAAAGNLSATAAAAAGLGASVLRVGYYPDGAKELHTSADVRSHEILGRLKRHFPTLSFVDEEDEEGLWRLPNRRRRGGRGGGLGGGATPEPPLRRGALPLSELALYVDPLDATQEYSEGLTEYVSLSACVVRCGRPIVGLVYLPFTGRLYWTRPGTGVHVNFDVDTAVMAERSIVAADWGDVDALNGVCCDERLAGHARDGPAVEAAAASAAAAEAEGAGGVQAGEVWRKGIRVIGSRSHAGNTSAAHAVVDHVAARLGPSAGEAEYIKAGGAGYKLVELVEGRADAYLHPSRIRKWDLCAGDALLRAAGGALTDWTGRPVDYCVYAAKGAQAAAGGGEGRGKAGEDEGAAAGGGGGVPPGAADPNQFLVGGVVAAAETALHADIFGGIKALSSNGDWEFARVETSGGGKSKKGKGKGGK